MGDWRDDYRAGTSVIWPKGEAEMEANRLREVHDPESQRICPAHITLTQPFLRTPDGDDLLRVAATLSQGEPFSLKVGPVEPFGTSSVLKFDVEPKSILESLRAKLHETGLFNLNLPFTDGFIPHMTISEHGLASGEEARRLAAEMNQRIRRFEFECTEVAYIRPNEAFEFSEIRLFPLGP